jgi:hydrogenase-4 component B
MIGALAVACFVKVYGVVFLGNPRTADATNVHESPLSMRGPMMALAACCVLIGLAPVLVSPILDKAIAAWMPELQLDRMSVATLVPLESIGMMSIALIVTAAVLTMILARCVRAAKEVNTWDCGYARPTNRMEYSASSFAQMIVSLFRWVLRPQVHRPAMEPLFPRPTKMHSEVNDVVLDRLLMPGGRFAERCVDWMRTFQRGLTQHYVLYILIAIVLMLSTLFPFDDLFARIFAR